jgi:hypothetical protein
MEENHKPIHAWNYFSEMRLAILVANHDMVRIAMMGCLSSSVVSVDPGSDGLSMIEVNI